MPFHQNTFRAFGRVLAGSLAASAVLLLADSAAYAQKLYPVQEFNLGSYRKAVLADINNDGRLDAIGVQGTNLVLAYGNGDGTFRAAQSLATTASAAFLAAADLNGDGKLDIVRVSYGEFDYVTNTYRNGSLSIMLGSGDGTFVEGIGVEIHSSPSAVTVADVNKDGFPDVIITDNGTYDYATGNYQHNSVVSVLLGNGDGTFQPRTDYTTGDAATAAAVGDVTGDGIPDIITANQGVAHLVGTQFNAYQTYVGSSLSLLVGQGSGTFTAHQDIPVGIGTDAITLADVNGDGHLDILAANVGTYSATTDSYANSTVSIIPGNGDGTFQTRTDYSVGGGPIALEAADINEDGALSVLTANYNGSVSVLSGSNGTFGARQDYPAAHRLTSLAIADLNNDGKRDIVAGSTLLNVLPANEDGTFTTRTEFPTTGMPDAAAFADVNGDGKLDMVVADGTIGVRFGNGDGTFGAEAEYDSGEYALVMADMNGDGIPDVVTLNDLGIIIQIGNGDGTFQPLQGYYAYGYSLAVADVNGDGSPDVIITGPYTYTASVFLNNGDGTLDNESDYTINDDPQIVAAADFNGQNQPDIVTANRNGTISLLKNNGDGTFADPVVIASASTNSLAIADVTGDGKPEIILSNGTILFQQSDANYRPVRSSPPFGIGSFWTTVGDVNGDGKLDLVSADYSSNSVRIALGNGDGTFAAPQAYATGRQPQYLAVGDIKGDGRLAIVTANFLDHSLSLLPNIAAFRTNLAASIMLEGKVSPASATILFEFRPDTGSSFTREVTVTDSGLFTFANLPPGHYTVHASGTKYLAQNVMADSTNGTVSPLPVYLPVGDATDDNVVDISDFGALTNAYGSTVSDPYSSYDPNADFNGDGLVDIADFGLFVSNYGAVGDL